MPTEIHASGMIRVVIFSANGEHILSGGKNQNVQVWRVQDGQRVATMEARDVRCLAASENGKWITAGTWVGEVVVWGTETYETVWEYRRDEQGYDNIRGVDFSPDSTRLISASWNRTATVWDVASGKKVRTLHHKDWVIAARYSQDGDRIATATYNGSVRVWDNDDGRLLVDIPVTVTSFYNNGLVWFNNYLFVLSGSTIKEMDPSTSSIVTEWRVPDSEIYSSIAIPKHGKFIAYSTGQTLTLWDMLSHTQLGPVQHRGDIKAITISPGDCFLAIGREDGTIITEGLPHFIVST